MHPARSHLSHSLTSESRASGYSTFMCLHNHHTVTSCTSTSRGYTTANPPCCAAAHCHMLDVHRSRVHCATHMPHLLSSHPLLLLQVLYATACCGAKPQGDGSFLPLSVHYQERFSAAGKTRYHLSVTVAGSVCTVAHRAAGLCTCRKAVVCRSSASAMAHILYSSSNRSIKAVTPAAAVGLSTLCLPSCCAQKQDFAHITCSSSVQ